MQVSPELEAPASPPGRAMATPGTLARRLRPSTGRIEVEFPKGVRVRIDGGVAGAALRTCLLRLTGADATCRRSRDLSGRDRLISSSRWRRQPIRCASREVPMALSIRQPALTVAGEAMGADCREPLSADQVAAIHSGMAECAVLVFRDQPLTDEEQLCFTLHLGALEETRGGTLRRRRSDPRSCDRSVQRRAGPMICGRQQPG